MLAWIIEPAISLSLFYLAYFIFLRKMPFFRANRYYLLTAIIFSIILPHISFAPPVTIVSYSYMIPEVTITGNYQGQTLQETGTSWTAGRILFLIYVAVASLLTLRLAWRLLQLFRLVGGNTSRKYRNVRIVNLGSGQPPFSFLYYIFLNESLYGEQEKQKIIEHELIHISQFHTFDLIVLEFLTIIQWFNPVSWLYRRSMLEIHEYIADEEVIKKGTSIPFYQTLLLNLQMGSGYFSPASNFNKSLTLNRIRMMTTIKPAAWKRIRFVILWPVLVLLVFMCTKADDEKPAVIETAPAGSADHKEAQAGTATFEEGRSEAATYTPVESETAAPGATQSETPLSGTAAIPATGPVTPVQARQVTEAGSTANEVTAPVTGTGISASQAEVRRTETGTTATEGTSAISGTVITRPEVPAPVTGTAAAPGDATTRSGFGTPLPLPSANEETEVFFIVEEMPDFQGGGQDGFRQYIAENLRYPQVAAENGIYGRVFVQFEVKADGSVANAQIVRGIDPNLDREAIRVIMASPKWEPGRQRGEAVNVAFTFPINFVLQ